MHSRLGVSFAIVATLGLAIVGLGGCDDDDGPQHGVVGRHDAGALRVGFGWRSTSVERLSGWGLTTPQVGQAAPVAMDALAGIRIALAANMLPPHDAVRVDELIRLGLPLQPPPEAAAPLPGPQIILTTTPWNDDTLLLWIAVPAELLAEGQSVSVEFDAKTVAAFRPLGDPQALTRPEGDGTSAALLYEISAPQDDRPRPDRRYAMLRIGPGAGNGADGKPARERDIPITAAAFIDSIDDAPTDVRFAAATAGFAELLRGDPAVRDLSCNDVINLAEDSDEPDPTGARAQLIDLMHRAEPLIDLPPADAPAVADEPAK
jgi:hypothetical protein